MLLKWTLWIQNLALPLACISYLTSIYLAPHLQIVTTVHSFTKLWGIKVATHVKALPHSKCSTSIGDYYFTIIILAEFNQNSWNKTNLPCFFFPSISKVSYWPRHFCILISSLISESLNSSSFLLSLLTPPIIVLFLSPNKYFFTLTSFWCFLSNFGET